MNNKAYIPSERTMEKIDTFFQTRSYVHVGTLAVEIGYSLLKTEMIIEHLIEIEKIRYATISEKRMLGLNDDHVVVKKLTASL